KLPTNGAYPRRMTQSIIDIFFLQQLINNGFSTGYFIFFTNLLNFTQGTETDGIYSYFRNRKFLNEFCCHDIPQFMLETEARKLFTLLDSNSIRLDGNYRIEFQSLINNNVTYYYFLIKLNRNGN
ncbi:MAG: hypothetical protein K8H86_03100, partial [Ignavibacteriaceae bacterium]|nr:hypothetical protein [Ignavibacteriaceae bacterium]